jgi:putative phosphoesterase
LVTSDTHVHDAARLPAELLAAADLADHIVHAGDHSCMEVVHVLRRFAPVTAVRGNVEDAETSAALEAVERVEVAGVRIGVTHDAGPSGGRAQRLADLVGAECALRVYGHSHLPEATRLADGSWMLNPGSPTQRRRAPSHTFAWVEVGAGEVQRVEIVRID